MAPSFEALSTSLTNGAVHDEVDAHTTRKSNAKNQNDREVQSPETPIPHVGVFDSSSYQSDDLLLADIVEGLRVAGGCIVRGLLNHETLAELESEIRPHLDKAGPSIGDFWPPQTRKVMGLMGKSKSFALNIVGNPIWQKVGEHFLTSELKDYYVGTEIQNSPSNPQINNTVVFSINPGATAQALHRDDSVHHNWPPAASSHTLGRDTGLALFVAGKRTTRQNGATGFIPGSHLWDYRLPAPGHLCYYAELEPGDAFMMLTGCYHAGSANTTETDERLLYSTGTTRGYLRQEENQYLAVGVERVRGMGFNRGMLRFMGFGLSRPFLGWVEMDDPLRVVDPEAEVEDDLF